MPQKTATDAQTLAQGVVEGLQDKKALDIVEMDLRHLKSAVADYFVIATGTSDTHVQALADSVQKYVRETMSEKPNHAEGVKQGEWVLLDYVNVVVHIFLQAKREFYAIEELWGDAKFRRIENP